MKTTYLKDIKIAMKEAGCQLVRRNNGHEIYRTPPPENKMIAVPRKFDDPRLYYRMLKVIKPKLAGAKL